MTGHIHRKTYIVGVVLMVLCLGALILALWPFESQSHLAVIAAVIRGGIILCALSMAAGIGGRWTYPQRAFLGLLGATMTMTVQSLLLEHTPYELWAAILSGIGLLGFLSTLVAKDLWHRIATLAGEEIG